MALIKRVLLKIYKTFLKLFIKRKMGIEEIVNKWHEDTQKWVESKIGTNILDADLIDKLCVCALKASAQYCGAIIQLLNSGHEYPTKALMRCLGELNMKFIWCIATRPEEENVSAAIEKRINRWKKTACSKGIQLLEDSISVMCPEDKEIHEKTLSDLNQHFNELDKLNVKQMPNFKQICEQLGDSFYEKIRPAFYSIFHDAVHLDPVSMAAIYGFLPQGRDVIRTYCVGFAYSINSLIRLKYELDTLQIKDEYDQLMKIV